MNVRSRLSTSNADVVEGSGSRYMDELIALLLSVLSGVIVSLVTLWLAGRQRVRQERRTETSVLLSVEK